MHLDRPAEAESAARRALEISPTYAGAHGVLAEVLLLEGKADAALAEMKIDNPKESATPRLVAVYWALHRTKESDALLARLAASSEAETLPAWVAGAYAYRGQENNALDLLEEAYARRDSRLWEIKSDLLLRGLDHNPRYKALLRRMNLLQ
jgi:thioredoxin-like negative regulator of GroEL